MEETEMKRDLDLIRQILQILEEDPSPVMKSVKVENRSDDEINYHLDKLIEAGYISTKPLSVAGQNKIHTQITLTWNGHEFLNASRSDTTWEKAKEKAAKIVGEVPLSVIMEILTAIIKANLGLV
jgi:predicted transcriptional regulator